MILIDQTAETTEKAAEDYEERIPAGAKVAAVINGYLRRGLGVYVPGWPGIIYATERTGSSWSEPWVAVTDEGAVLVDPVSRTVEYSYALTYTWPKTLITISAIGDDGQPADDEPPPETTDPPATDPAVSVPVLAIVAAAAAVLLIR